MFESELVKYLINNHVSSFMNGDRIDKDILVNEAWELGYNAYWLEGDGCFDQTIIFINEE